jgi:tetratricopeptide (TPR) repeat protein
MNCLRSIIKIWALVVVTGILLLPGIVQAQENDRTELLYTQRLSKRFPDSAFLLLKEMYGKAIAGKDRLTMGICLQQMGQVCYFLGNYPKALDFHRQADKIFREANNTTQVARNLNDMGLVYYQNRQIPVARKQYEEALAIYFKTKNSEGLADTYGKIGHLYEKQKQYDSAFYFQRQALQQSQGLAQQQQVVAKIYENIGSIYEDLERYDSAWYYFNHSLSLYDQVNDQVAGIEVINNLGDIYRKTGRYREAIGETYKALTRAEALNDLYQKGAAYRDLGKAWNLLGQNDSAYYYIDLSRRASIDIYSAENNRQTAFFSVLFDIDKKNEEIVLLENARNITFVITVAVIIVVVLLVILGWVTISRQRLKIRNEQILSEQNRHIYETQKDLMQVELANRQLQEDKLMEELEIKKKGLTSYTLHIIQKNQSLEDLRNKLEILIKDDKRDQKKQLQQLIHQINQNFNHDQYWNEFRETVEQIHQPFFDNLKEHCDDLTSNDLRMLSLIKLNMASKDMAILLGISQDSLRVSRYRLKKKLNLEQGESLTGFVQGL